MCDDLILERVGGAAGGGYRSGRASWSDLVLGIRPRLAAAVASLPLVALAFAPAAAAAAPVVTTIAGGVPGQGLGLQLGQTPYELAVHGTDVVLEDTRYCAVRQLDTTTGLETTLMTLGAPGSRCHQFLGLDLQGRPLLSHDHGLFRLETTGTQTRLIGTGADAQPTAADEGQPATSVPVRQPTVVTTDPTGALWFADASVAPATPAGPPGDLVAMIDPAGRYHTVVHQDGSASAGSTTGGYGLRTVSGLAVTADGALHVAVTGTTSLHYPVDSSLWRVTASGMIAREAGACEAPQPEGTPEAQACFRDIGNLSVATDGALLVSDASTIRAFEPDGTTRTVAGTATAMPGDRPTGVATSALLGDILAVAGAGDGGFYVADSRNQRLDRVTPTGVIAPVAGDGTSGAGGDGGPAVEAQLDDPAALAHDPAGNVFVADRLANRVREISPSGTIRTIAGTGQPGETGDGGPATAATLYGPSRLALAPDGTLYVSAGRDPARENPTVASAATDPTPSVVRRISPDGQISTVAGGAPNSSPQAPEGGPATGLSLGLVNGLAIGTQGDVYLSDHWNYATGADVILRVDAAGRWHRFAGYTTSPPPSNDGGPALTTGFQNIGGMTADGAGGLFVSNALRVRHILPNGTVASYAGTDWNPSSSPAQPPFSGDGGPAALAHLSGPEALALDGAGGLVVVDQNNQRVRHVNSYGQISTVAGDGIDHGPSPDGRAPTATPLPGPTAVDVVHGRLLLGDGDAHALRAVDLPTTASPIDAHWAALGDARSVLGDPIAAEYPLAGGRARNYQHGSIYWSVASNLAREVHGAILARYRAVGGPTGILGYPTTDETAAGRVAGRFNECSHGTISWSTASGAHEVHGSIRARWISVGREGGQLGFPTSDEYAVTGGRRNDFVHGSIIWNARTGSTTVNAR